MKQIPENVLGLVKAHISPNPVGMWRRNSERHDGVCYESVMHPFSVISSVCIEDDGKRWLHVSFAHPKRMPTYDEIQKVRKDFIGEDKYAIMVFPEKDKYVNIHPFCLHLWHCIDGHPLPEFSGFIPGFGRTI